MVRISYPVKLLLLLLGLVMVLQITSYGATRLVIREAVADNARQELLRGGEVFAQLMQARVEQLALSVNVLTDDFGFRDAVASRDAETIRSALLNHSARIEADVGMVFSPHGELVASSVELPGGVDQRLVDLQAEVLRNRTAYASVIINDKPYQFVLSSVRAPLVIGLAGMGFEIEENLTAALKRLTGLEVSFIRRDPQSVTYLSGTLSDETRARLLSNLQTDAQPENVVWQTAGMMNLLVPIAQDESGLAAVLQVPLSQVLEPFAALDAQLFWLALVFSFGAAALALILARKVTRPLRALAETSKAIAVGNYTLPVPIHSNDEFGDLGHAFVKMQTAIGEREIQIIEQAQHDPLTRLPNRSRVFPRMESAIARAHSLQQPFSLLVIDIFNFTQINDELTPEIGDHVLYEVGQRIAGAVSSADSVLRLGSDEFLVIAMNCDTPAAVALADIVHRAHSEFIVAGGFMVKVDLNIGLVAYPHQGDAPEILLRRANLALHHGRQLKQKTCVYQQGWDEGHLRRLLLLREFERALESDQIALNYQPKIDLRNPQVLSAEALVRWHHPTMGFVNPDEFIAVIESAGQVTVLTRWVLKTAICYLRKLIDADISLTLSVNLSAQDLLVDDLPDYIQTLLHEQGIAAHQLCLEITESAIMREAEKSLLNLNRLRSLGIGLSIDDFGTGYSSLSQLKKLPVCELKIDKSFILHLDKNADDQLIVRSTIELGHTMGLHVTAEGVESEAIQQLLISYGCDTAQGYFYSKAISDTLFIAWIKNYIASISNV